MTCCLRHQSGGACLVSGFGDCFGRIAIHPWTVDRMVVELVVEQQMVSGFGCVIRKPSFQVISYRIAPFSELDDPTISSISISAMGTYHEYIDSE